MPGRPIRHVLGRHVLGRLGVGAALLLAVPGQGRGQAVNTGALDALAPARPASRPAPPRPAPPTRPASPARPASSQPAAPARPAAPKPALPTGGTPHRPAPAQPGQAAIPVPPRPPAVPVAPPAIAAIPPAVAVPVARPPAPPPVPVAEDAPGEASPIPGGIRVTFGATRADLNAVTEPALRTFARTLRDNEQATVNLVATAAGSADDPSTPRRLSLSRALAARAVLVNEGVASTRIYVRALGANGPAGPADRVDLTTAGPAP